MLEKIIELEKIAATEKEIDAKIEEQAKSVGKSAEEYKKTLDPRQRSYIENDIKVTKAFEFLEKNNEMYFDADKPAAAKKPAAKKTGETKSATEKKETAAKPKTTAKKATASKTTAEKKEN